MPLSLQLWFAFDFLLASGGEGLPGLFDPVATHFIVAVYQEDGLGSWLVFWSTVSPSCMIQNNSHSVRRTSEGYFKVSRPGFGGCPSGTTFVRSDMEALGPS